ncbi:hypothetical protein [Endozoicomonas lisbonensis]|uniref:Uncharacterized protein n=1 Tax=Endozoicomonas lisbonensis TaxID=3120522 RepID=A0ABV2SKX0_9GAMM
MVRNSQPMLFGLAVVWLLFISAFSWNVQAANKNDRPGVKYFYQVVDNRTQRSFVFHLNSFGAVDISRFYNSAFSVSEITQNEAADAHLIFQISVRRALKSTGVQSQTAKKERMALLFTQIDAINYLNRSRIYRRHFNTDFESTHSRTINIRLSSEITSHMSSNTLLSTIETGMQSLMDERRVTSWSFQGVSADEHTAVDLRIRLTAHANTNGSVNSEAIRQYLTDRLNAEHSRTSRPADGMNEMLTHWQAQQEQVVPTTEPETATQESGEAAPEPSGSVPTEAAPLTGQANEEPEATGERATLSHVPLQPVPLQELLKNNGLDVITNAPEVGNNVQYYIEYCLSLTFRFYWNEHDEASRSIPDSVYVERINDFFEGISQHHASSFFTLTLSHIQPSANGVAVYYHLTQRLFPSQDHMDKIKRFSLRRHVHSNQNLWGADEVNPLYIAQSVPSSVQRAPEPMLSCWGCLISVLLERLIRNNQQPESPIDLELKPQVQLLMMETVM